MEGLSKKTQIECIIGPVGLILLDFKPTDNYKFRTKGGK